MFEVTFWKKAKPKEPLLAFSKRLTITFSFFISSFLLFCSKLTYLHTATATATNKVPFWNLTFIWKQKSLETPFLKQITKLDVNIIMYTC